MFESITKEMVREALQKAVEDVGMDVAVKAFTNAPMSESDYAEAINN